MIKSEILDEQPDFSLVLGGPLFQLYRRAHLSGDALELVRRRVVIIAVITWLPLLLLSLIGGHALGGASKVPFLYDVDVHVRFLIALPILIAADLIVGSRLRRAVKRFAERGIIVPGDMPKYRAAIHSAMGVRNSVTVEVALLILVYTLGLWIWRSHVAGGAASWYEMPAGSQLNLTPAGYWYVFVSIPIFQFMLLRWYLRFFIWFQFLWRISRLKLRLIATHPDRVAGIGFLGQTSYAFAPILFAQGAMLSGVVASRIFYEGKSLLAFKMEAASLILFYVFAVLSPLLVFAAPLGRAKRDGLSRYGLLSSRYVQGFDEKWIQGGAPKHEEIMGSGDIQSLADLGNSFAVVRETRLVPFGLTDVARLAAATAVPLLPLALTVFSLEELVTRLIKILF